MKLERDIQAQITKYLRNNGIWHVKIITANRNGIPDLICLRKGIFIAIELKRPGHKPTDLQQAELDRIKQAGGFSFCCHSLEEVKAIFEPLTKDEKDLTKNAP